MVAPRVPLEMSDRGKGALVAILAILAIGTTWAMLADPQRMCPGGSPENHIPGCTPFDPPPPGAFLVGALFVGVPCALIVGRLIGALASRLPRGRPLVLAAIASAVALLPTGAATAFWPGDPPIFSKLAVPAIFFSLLAGLVLERWTRRPPSVPVAVARSMGAVVGA